MTHAAILRGFAARRFLVVKDEPGMVTGRWQKGGAFLDASAAYNETQVVVRYVNSDHGVAPDGYTAKRYLRYMRNLRKTINKELGRPAKDADKQARLAAEQAAAAARLEQKRLAEEARRKRTVLVGKPTTAVNVRAQIILALQDRKYTVESEEGAVITARWSKQDLFYRLSITYSETQIELIYIDSDHKNDDEDEGVQIIDEKYIDYMGRLAGSLSKALNE